MNFVVHEKSFNSSYIYVTALFSFAWLIIDCFLQFVDWYTNYHGHWRRPCCVYPVPVESRCTVSREGSRLSTQLRVDWQWCTNRSASLSLSIGRLLTIVWYANNLAASTCHALHASHQINKSWRFQPWSCIWAAYHWTTHHSWWTSWMLQWTMIHRMHRV